MEDGNEQALQGSLAHKASSSGEDLCVAGNGVAFLPAILQHRRETKRTPKDSNRPVSDGEGGTKLN